MKKLFRTFALLTITSTIALANIKPESSIKVGMYNVKNTHKIKVFVEKQNTDPLIMEVLDLNGNQIQKSFFGKDKTQTGLNLDLSHLEDGEYILKISDKKDIYTKKIEVKKEKVEELKIVI